MDWFGPTTGGLLGVLLFGCFIQVLTILSLLRYGLGLGGFDFGVVSFILALVLSCLMVEAKFGLTATLENTVEGKPISFSSEVDTKVRPFLIAASDPIIAQRVSSLTGKLASSPNTAVSPDNSSAVSTSLAQLETTFLLSQLKRSLAIGLMLLIPLLVIDLMVAFSLTLVGVQSISAVVISVPLKLLLFVSIDGWGLIVDKLLAGFI